MMQDPPRHPRSPGYILARAAPFAGGFRPSRSPRSARTRGLLPRLTTGEHLLPREGPARSEGADTGPPERLPTVLGARMPARGGRGGPAGSGQLGRPAPTPPRSHAEAALGLRDGQAGNQPRVRVSAHVLGVPDSPAPSGPRPSGPRAPGSSLRLRPSFLPAPSPPGSSLQASLLDPRPLPAPLLPPAPPRPAPRASQALPPRCAGGAWTGAAPWWRCRCRARLRADLASASSAARPSRRTRVGRCKERAGPEGSRGESGGQEGMRKPAVPDACFIEPTSPTK